MVRPGIWFVSGARAICLSWWRRVGLSVIGYVLREKPTLDPELGHHLGFAGFVWRGPQTSRLRIATWIQSSSTCSTSAIPCAIMAIWACISLLLQLWNAWSLSPGLLMKKWIILLKDWKSGQKKKGPFASQWAVHPGKSWTYFVSGPSGSPLVKGWRHKDLPFIPTILARRSGKPDSRLRNSLPDFGWEGLRSINGMFHIPYTIECVEHSIDTSGLWMESLKVKNAARLGRFFLCNCCQLANMCYHAGRLRYPMVVKMRMVDHQIRRMRKHESLNWSLNVLSEAV